MTFDVLDGTTVPDAADEPLQLTTVARMLRDHVLRLPPSYVEGKTVLRDVVMDHFDCSAVRAERIVDRLEANGLVRFERERRGRLWTDAKWHIGPQPGAFA